MKYLMKQVAENEDALRDVLPMDKKGHKIIKLYSVGACLGLHTFNTYPELAIGDEYDYETPVHICDCTVEWFEALEPQELRILKYLVKTKIKDIKTLKS